jgi:dsDNA-specific endonuclease/ATPase MutS2
MFKIGDFVHITNVGKGVIREVRNGNRYVVEIKGRTVVASAQQLSAIEDTSRRPKPPPGAATTDLPAGLARAHAASQIDLHGMTAPDAVAALDMFLNDAILAAHDEVRVIHGRSGGRLKAAVHQRLRALPSVRDFRVDPANPGVTIVTL